MSTAPLIMTAISGVGSAYSAEQAGRTNSAIDRFNARQDRVEAQETLQSAGSQRARQDIKERILQGAQRSGFAGQGVVANAGTARAVYAGSEAVSEMDKLMIDINARRTASGHLQRAAYADFQGDQARIRGNEAALADLTNAGAKAESQYYEGVDRDKKNYPDKTFGSDKVANDRSTNSDYQMKAARQASLLANESDAGDYPTSAGHLNFT